MFGNIKLEAASRLITKDKKLTQSDKDYSNWNTISKYPNYLANYMFVESVFF
jgi:hypothetical protein